MNFKMYRFVCFILLVNLSTTILADQPENTSTNATAIQPAVQNTTAIVTESTNYTSITTTKTMEKTGGTTQKQSTPPIITKNGCLINLDDEKDRAVWLIILLLVLICLLLLMIIMCMACKCCRGIRTNEVVMLKSSTSVRRNSVNGGPSETDVLLKDCSSVKVEMETIPAESEKPEEAGGADAEDVENQDSTKENKNSANDTSETAPTQEVDQSAETDLKTEALENAE